MALTRPELEQFAKKERGNFERLLKEFVEIPSVSADPDRKADLERCAELGLETVRAMGGRAEIHRVPDGPPVVLGSFGSAKGRPTLTIYNHLDVVPASKETEPWRTDPFTFIREGTRTAAGARPTTRARRSRRSSGPAPRSRRACRSTSRFLWELEEEVGSPHFADTLRAIGSAAATDAVVVSDTVWVSRARPALSGGLRGLQRVTFRLETAQTDQHSGSTGGVARNPLAELAQLVSEIFDARTGRVKIPGFYDDVEKLDEAADRGLQGGGFSVPRFKRGLRLQVDPDERPARCRSSGCGRCRPSRSTASWAGTPAPASRRSSRPRRAQGVHAPRPEHEGREVVKLVKAFVKKRNPDVQVEAGAAAPAYKGVTTGPYVEAAKRAMKFAFGKDPVFVREGGTIGAILFMEQILKCPIVFMGLSLPEHGYHAPNENYDWHQAGGGIAAFAKFIEEIALHPR